MQRIKQACEKFAEAFTACGLAMVQLDVSVLTLDHVITAAKTGSLTALAILAASYTKWNTERLALFLTGLFTMLADLAVHQSHLNNQFAEAVATGVGAMALAYVWDLIKNRKN